MSGFVIDAYAWVEYFKGTEQGKKVKKLVEDAKNTIHTNIITLAELSSFFEKHGKDSSQEMDILLSLPSIHPLTIEFVQQAGKLHATIRKKRKHMGLADVFVLLTAQKLHAKVVTGDEDFRGLKEVIMIK